MRTTDGGSSGMGWRTVMNDWRRLNYATHAVLIIVLATVIETEVVGIKAGLLIDHMGEGVLSGTTTGVVNELVLKR